MIHLGILLAALRHWGHTLLDNQHKCQKKKRFLNPLLCINISITNYKPRGLSI